MGRSRKGAVIVAVDRGMLRLRWSYAGKRYSFATGLADNARNRRAAEVKAGIIEGDIATGNFDFSLAKYRPKSADDAIAATDLFQQFFDWRRSGLEPTTQDKYRAIAKHIKEFFKGKSAESIKARDCDRFKDWLLTWLQPVTAKDRISVVRACWEWGIEAGKVTENPWKQIKVSVPTKVPEPFTAEEVQKIIEGFESDRYYRHYTPFVRFMFATGLRTGEIIGLRWEHFSESCDRVDVVERLSRSGERRETKNHRVRALALSPVMQSFLLEYRPVDYRADDLVFPGPKGAPINDTNFRKRAWSTVLKTVGVRYRKPYNTRHTALSHAIARGVSPARVAEMAGDRLDTVLRSYVGNVEGLPESLDF